MTESLQNLGPVAENCMIDINNKNQPYLHFQPLRIKYLGLINFVLDLKM